MTETVQTSTPPAGDQTPATPTGDQFTDEAYNSLYSRYKSDPREISKAKWEADKTITRLQQELAAAKKSATSGSQTSASSQSPAPQSSQANGDAQANADAPKGAADAGDPAPTTGDLLTSAYMEAFESGSISEGTKALFAKAGIPEADASLLTDALNHVVATRVKEAQKHVETDVKTLKQWAEQPGNMSDQELAVIQAALNQGNYSILRDVERKYKGSLKTVVEHGSVGSSTDAYAGPDDYYRDRRDSKYGWDREYTAAVDQKFRRSNTGDWTKKMLGL